MSDILQLEQQAESLRDEGKYQEAIDKLHELLKLDESFVRGHLAMSLCYHYAGDHQQSVRHAERAVELEPNDPLNMANLSRVYQWAFEATRDPIFIQKAEAALARGMQ